MVYFRMNINLLYRMALREGEGFGTAYEYMVKRKLLCGLFDRINPRSVLIFGLPEKYGASMDFILLGQEYGARITVVDDREFAIKKFREVMDALGGDKIITSDVDVIFIDNLLKYRSDKSYDIALSMEVVQRFSGENRLEYLEKAVDLADNVLVFAPNAGNKAHANISGLDTLDLNDFKNMVNRINQKIKIIDTGYIDMPPFFPGLKVSKNKKENFIVGVTGRLLLCVLRVWYFLEFLAPVPIKRRLSHIAYVVLKIPTAK